MPNSMISLWIYFKTLENHYKDMQDMEFTFQEGKLFMLQTRTGKRTAASAIQVAVDMVNEGLIDKKTAVMRVEPSQLDQLLHKQLDPKEKAKSKVNCKRTCRHLREQQLAGWYFMQTMLSKKQKKEIK